MGVVVKVGVIVLVRVGVRVAIVAEAVGRNVFVVVGVGVIVGVAVACPSGVRVFQKLSGVKVDIGKGRSRFAGSSRISRIRAVGSIGARISYPHKP